MNTQTPAPQAPSPQPQAQQEVPINQQPTHQPAPVGSQAPNDPNAPTPEGSKHRPESRREAIQKAFQRAEEAADTPETKPKPASRPPEKKSDAKAQQQQPEQRQPHREGGRFARDPNQQQQPPQGQQPPQQRQQYAPLPETAPFRDPPQRMADHAKAEWAGTPESVRGEIARMHHEFSNAYNQYRADNETMNSIRHFHQMATQHGTTLDKALTNYVGMEQKLRSDLVGGLDMIVNNLGLRTQDGRPISLRDVAYHILNQSPDQHRMVQTGNAQQAMSLQLGKISQRLDQMDQNQRRMQEEVVFHQTRAGVDAYADDGNHPRFDELADLIEMELQHGYDLETAYRRAELLRPANPRAPQTRNSQAAQTRGPAGSDRPVDRSISGSPDGGANGATISNQRKPGKQVGRREAIQNAMRRANGSF